jgi:tetratricopeptide (TPR) repeat protein
MNRSTTVAVISLAVALLVTSPAAAADEIADVGRLHRAGQTGAAINRAEQYLGTKPDDAPMRFVLGVMLAESQRSTEALDVFLKLTLDHPELAEPHNNLAALYAAAGEYDKARVALEQALRANPNYATANENLGDVYAMLASQAYARAARLDPDNARLRPKIALARELVTPKSSESGARPKATP